MSAADGGGKGQEACGRVAIGYPAPIYLTHQPDPVGSGDEPDRRPWLPRGFAFLSGYPTPARKRKVLVPIQVMVDDSGGEGQGLVLVLGGLIGRAEDWASFADLWSAALAKTPAIRYFSMRDAMGRNGEFYGFSEEARDAKLRKLAAIIDGFGFEVIHVTMEVTGFSAFYKPHSPAPENTPYFHAFLSIIQVAYHTLRRRGETERFEMFFDEQRALGPKAKQWYPIARMILEELEPGAAKLLAADIQFKDDKEFLPLQAADMIAWLRRLGANAPQDPNLERIAAYFDKTTVSGYSQHLSMADMLLVLARTVSGASKLSLEVEAEVKRLRGIP